MGKNIVLIGFMGTGKTTIGIRLAQILKMDFIDMDKEIERVTGHKVEEIFRIYGEKRFRSEESLLANKLGKCDNLVISTGGGIILCPENTEALQANGVLIRLYASPEAILDRVSRKKGTRPLLNKKMDVESIRQMLGEREDLYQCAEYHVNTENREMEAIVDEILKLLKTQESMFS